MSILVLVNNAGVAFLESQCDPSSWGNEWARVLDTNVTSIRLLTHHFMPLLAQSSDARVINVSSARGSFIRVSSGNNPPTASLPYSVSKAALNMLTLEMGKANPSIAFHDVSPGHCKTAFNGFKGKKDPVDGGRVVAELALCEGGRYDSGFW